MSQQVQNVPVYGATIHVMQSLRMALVAVFAIGSLGACKDDSDAADPELADKSAQLAGDEESLLQRRDALLNSRRKLREQRQAIEKERQRVLASGGDVSEVEKRSAALLAEEEKLVSKQEQLDEELGSFIAEQRNVLQSIASKGGEAAQLASREGALASREKLLAKRETELANREAALARREGDLAKREKETCSGAVVMPSIAPVKPPGGTTYRKKDVEPLLSSARRSMSKKGIRQSDLPPQAKGLQSEATKAMKKGDYASAHFAARQLKATVDAIKVDRAFIQAKIGRLSNYIKSNKPSESDQKQVDRLFKDATRYYGDGKYSRANKKLNEIYSKLR